MEKYFPESETLSIKRLKVAIEKKNWELLEKGIKKALEMRNAGQKFNQVDLWQNLLIWAESEDIPPDLWEKLSDFVDKLSGEFTRIAQQNSEIIAQYHEKTSNLIDKEVAIIYNQTFDKNTYDSIRKYRVNLNNIIHNPDKYSFDPKWMNELAALTSVFDEPQDDLKGFISLISLFKRNGAIITNSYSSSIHKMLVKADINITYPGAKAEIKKSEKNWELYSLGGTINSFICTSCGHRTIKTEYHSKTLAECCNKCKSPMYPDISCTGDNYLQIMPHIWYGAYENLVSSRTWVIIAPPSHNDQVSLRSLLLDAAKNSCIEEVYLITHKVEVFELWRSKIINLVRNVEIKENYPSIASLIEAYNEANIVKNQPGIS